MRGGGTFARPRCRRMPSAECVAGVLRALVRCRCRAALRALQHRIPLAAHGRGQHCSGRRLCAGCCGQLALPRLSSWRQRFECRYRLMRQQEVCLRPRRLAAQAAVVPWLPPLPSILPQYRATGWLPHLRRVPPRRQQLRRLLLHRMRRCRCSPNFQLHSLFLLHVEGLCAPCVELHAQAWRPSCWLGECWILPLRCWCMRWVGAPSSGACWSGWRWR